MANLSVCSSNKGLWCVHYRCFWKKTCFTPSAQTESSTNYIFFPAADISSLFMINYCLCFWSSVYCWFHSKQLIQHILQPIPLFIGCHWQGIKASKLPNGIMVTDVEDRITLNINISIVISKPWMAIYTWTIQPEMQFGLCIHICEWFKSLMYYLFYRCMTYTYF